ncbi:MAG: ROK family protein [Nitrospiraceae bacterium]
MTRKMRATGPRGRARTLAVDIGGSGIKAIVLDQAGRAVTTRARLETPHPATPIAVIDTIRKLATQQRPFDRVSVGFPGVVRNGVTETAHNLDRNKWMQYQLASTLSAKLGKPVRVANDADVQGFGAIKGRGVEVVITLGTGVGSASFLNGRLVPNLELAHHAFRKGQTYEEQLGNAAFRKVGKKRWNKRLRKAVRTLERLFNFDRLYIGGGNAKNITTRLPANVKIVPNIAGLLGGIALWRE